MTGTEGSQGGSQQGQSATVNNIAQALGISPNQWGEFVTELRNSDLFKTHFDNGPSSLNMVYEKILGTVPAQQTAGR